MKKILTLTLFVFIGMLNLSHAEAVNPTGSNTMRVTLEDRVYTLEEVKTILKWSNSDMGKIILSGGSDLDSAPKQMVRNPLPIKPTFADLFKGPQRISIFVTLLLILGAFVYLGWKEYKT